ncbi:hypothetical protein Tsubulata_038986, partial [Turnera subulata]
KFGPTAMSMRPAQIVEATRKKFKEEYRRLNDYLQTLKNYNPGSTVVLDIEEDDFGNHVFKRLYICFKALKEGRFHPWLQSYRCAINPISGQIFWDECGLPVVHPPDVDPKRGRPQTQRRKEEGEKGGSQEPTTAATETHETTANPCADEAPAEPHREPNGNATDPLPSSEFE